MMKMKEIFKRWKQVNLEVQIGAVIQNNKHSVNKETLATQELLAKNR